jgi:hypothetical protein
LQNAPRHATHVNDMTSLFCKTVGTSLVIKNLDEPAEPSGLVSDVAELIPTLVSAESIAFSFRYHGMLAERFSLWNTLFTLLNTIVLRNLKHLHINLNVLGSYCSMQVSLQVKVPFVHLVDRLAWHSNRFV